MPNARIDAYVVYTNNPPCGAMRGFGAVQVAFAPRGADGQARRGARTWTRSSCGIRNAMAPGQPHADRPASIGEPAPVAELLERVRGDAAAAGRRRRDLRELPGGVANIDPRRGRAARRRLRASGFKNIGFSEGFDDYSTARVRLSMDGGEPLVEVHTAAAEVGQGLVTVQAQIARTELGVERVVVLTADTRVGSAGLELGLAPDLRHRRRGQGRVRGGARARWRRWRPSAA